MTLANIVTLLNLVAGILAIESAILGEAATAALLIVAGAIFDIFDGRIARAMKQESHLGKELDSLADIVTFGVAPVLLALTLYDHHPALLVIGVLYVVAGAYRLARFNTQRAKEFRGLPIPAAALVSLPITLYAPVAGVAAALIILAALMASTFRIPKL